MERESSRWERMKERMWQPMISCLQANSKPAVTIWLHQMQTQCWEAALIQNERFFFCWIEFFCRSKKNATGYIRDDCCHLLMESPLKGHVTFISCRRSSMGKFKTCGGNGRVTQLWEMRKECLFIISNRWFEQGPAGCETRIRPKSYHHIPNINWGSALFQPYELFTGGVFRWPCTLY